MARDDRQDTRDDVALGDLEIGPADRAGDDGHDDLAGCGLGVGELDLPERRVVDRSWCG
jgi:hypothetical protein